MDVRSVKHVHLVGIGGINMSGVAKILLAAGIAVSGSDLVESEQTKALVAKGATVVIGEDPKNIPAETELLIHTSAAGVMNKERIEGARRKIPEMNNFTFLSEWFADAKTLVVTGTHGKSTTTALLGLTLEKAGMNPTVVVGSKVATFPDGNMRLGDPNLFVVEGDEYARHFLEFHPTGVILNNLELDHTDVFSSIDSLIGSFHDLVGQVKDGGVVVANIGDERIAALIDTERGSLEARNVRVVPFVAAHGDAPAPGIWQVSSVQKNEHREMTLAKDAVTYRFILSIPGQFNAMNAAAAALLAMEYGATYEQIAATFLDFNGIWRRFELLGERNGTLIYSDYGHHPTAVAATLAAAHESFPDRRVVLAFQPHHRNRTKSLFLDFVPCFDAADVLLLCEIYDVAGRDDQGDRDISSHDLVDAVTRHDADRGVTRTVEYAADPAATVTRALNIAQPNDVVIFMGAGDIDGAIRSAL